MASTTAVTAIVERLKEKLKKENPKALKDLKPEDVTTFKECPKPFKWGRKPKLLN